MGNPPLISRRVLILTVFCLLVLGFNWVIGLEVIEDNDGKYVGNQTVLSPANPVLTNMTKAMNSNFDTEAQPVVIEVAIVSSKQFSDNFQNDREKMLDFFSAYFWDISMHFQTLPSSKILFSITSLTLVSSKDEQPFIEELRDPKFGNASLHMILPRFMSWITEKSAILPGFDMALLVTEPGIDKNVDGVAPLGKMCDISLDNSSVKLQSVVILDGTLKSGSDHIAHLLGAPYDDKTTMCKNGEISQLDSSSTQGTDTAFPHFFSFCADESISNFIASQNSKCLKTKSSTTEPLTDPDFDSVLPPSIEEQCRLLSGDRNVSAIPKDYGKECGLTLCTGNRSTILISPLENSQCGNGWRCFHGRCIPAGSLLSNVGTGKCLLPVESPSMGVREIRMTKCPRTSAPFQRFYIEDFLKIFGNINLLIVQSKTLPVDFDGDEIGYQKCLSAIRPFAGFAMLQKCNVSDDLQKWILVDERRDENDFLLYNVGANSCLKPRMYRNHVESLPEDNFQDVDETVFLHPDCDTKDPNFRWKSFPVLSVALGICPYYDYCHASLTPETSIKFFSSSNLVFLNVTLKNIVGVTVAPAALISWNSNLTLTTMPENCLRIQSGLKCKLGRLLTWGEKSLVAELEFDASNMTLDIDRRNLREQFNISVTATMAKTMDSGVTPQAKFPRSGTQYTTGPNLIPFFILFFILVGILWVISNLILIIPPDA